MPTDPSPSTDWDISDVDIRNFDGPHLLSIVETINARWVAGTLTPDVGNLGAARVAEYGEYRRAASNSVVPLQAFSGILCEDSGDGLLSVAFVNEDDDEGLTLILPELSGLDESKVTVAFLAAMGALFDALTEAGNPESPEA